MNIKVTCYLPLLAAIAFAGCKKDDAPGKEETPSTIQFVFTSDAHYGITRPAFRGGTNVDAHTVNAAMVASMNTLPELTLPADGGINAGKKIGSVDYIMEAGDIANRMEVSASVQTAAVSWTQFKTDYLQSLTLKDQHNQPAGFLMVPGNHDVSNTIGYYGKMQPLTDASSMAEIYNLMLKPSLLKTPITYSYNGDRINYSRDIAGVHFCFIQMWPDSAVRVWLNQDLQNVKTTTPVVIVAHDQPAVVSNHFTNPNGDHSINNTDKFDNVLDEHFKDGTSPAAAGIIEQRAFAAFLKQHTNIRLYLHGHVHETKFYTWTGPDNDVSLSAVSADSPMKGLVSAADETKLTYLFAALDPATMQLTLRECYWNTVPGTPATPVVWGKMITVDLKTKG